MAARTLRLTVVTLAVPSILLSLLLPLVQTLTPTPQPRRSSLPGAPIQTDSFTVSLGIITTTNNNNNKPNDDDDNDNDGVVIPYQIISEPFHCISSSFQILLYPRGLSGRSSSVEAAAYVRYLPPSSPGCEIDLAWTLQLISVNGRTLPITTSGGLTTENDAWSSAMTFCSPEEATESLGRTNDWGGAVWSSDDVVRTLLNDGEILAVGTMELFDERREEKSLRWPPGGALGAVMEAMSSSRRATKRFRAGEVLILTSLPPDKVQSLHKMGIYPNIEYRVMTLTDSMGYGIFTTASLPEQERSGAKLALRPVGWKLQYQMWQSRGVTNWPVEIDAGLISTCEPLTRFNLGSFVPRLRSTISYDASALALVVAIALAPLPLALFVRQFVSIYAIPSASMEPTLLKGDVLLVEKFPGVYGRTSRGDVVLFRPPETLRELLRTSTKVRSNLGSESLFVKRIVGLPGDSDVRMDASTKEVSIGGTLAVGPDRNLCDDEPLKLIDSLLERGKGRDLPTLGEDDVFVLGDCKAVSVDSRVFGSLPKDNIVGRPVARIWPIRRFSVGSL